MTKRGIIHKWENVILETWQKEQRTGKIESPKNTYARYNQFINECKEDGYIGQCTEDLWQDAVTRAGRKVR